MLKNLKLGVRRVNVKTFIIANEQEKRVSTPHALIKASLFDVLSLPGANIGDVGLIHLCQVISNKNCK